MSDDRGLLARANAARELIGVVPCVNPLVVLSYVVWPTAALAASPPPRLRQLPPETVERIFELPPTDASPVSAVLQRGRERALERVA